MMASLALSVMALLGEQTRWTAIPEGRFNGRVASGPVSTCPRGRRSKGGCGIGGRRINLSASSTSERVRHDRLAVEAASADNDQTHFDARCLPCRTGRVLSSYAPGVCPRQGIAFLRSSAEPSSHGSAQAFRL